jgi:ubiquinone/menaquinone biosynthesis C-methylase UbiE
MKEKTTANLEETGKYYDEHVFNELGFENPLFFKRMVVNLLLKYKSDLKNKKLIDIGCGNGNFLEYAEEFFETYGVDISKKAIEIANERCKKTKLSISVAEKLKFSDRFFDAAVCLGSLEHFVNMDDALSEMRRVLKPDGLSVIHVPNSMYLIHKILGVTEHGQINERMGEETEWRDVIEKYFKILECYKYNTRWYFNWIPKKYSCHFTFLCCKNES